MLVCQLWAKLLRYRTLYETVNICKYYKLDNFIKAMVKQMRHQHGQHVERLMLHDCIPESIYLRPKQALIGALQTLVIGAVTAAFSFGAVAFFDDASPVVSKT
jgi:hypothetical protein